jgi:hypothetical protein
LHDCALIASLMILPGIGKIQHPKECVSNWDEVELFRDEERIEWRMDRDSVDFRKAIIDAAF